MGRGSILLSPISISVLELIRNNPTEKVAKWATSEVLNHSVLSERAAILKRLISVAQVIYSSLRTISRHLSMLTVLCVLPWHRYALSTTIFMICRPYCVDSITARLRD